MSSINDALENKEKLIKWLIDLRNAIYEDNLIPQNKKTMSETFNEIFIDNTNMNMTWVYFIGLFLILVFLIFLYKYIRKDKDRDK
jgi:heme/copper-type cytochrome/quinol oxidase subunit 2